ncbi:hypothetical protein CYMTET_10091 [Cymbomonas tetramitiformis]|uniref:PiggyBac transposable element-derived protein domain-containing protein n=1 Tax=Cymbomonas tetramitiformis TaxID=36881 RepID=A0AAE0GQG2_9CHLO|nr:hypothetical protein CYMTET_44063 [Cymbomonas tetramitiformis]KAK3251185.1 hypothetical protein CYMTET_39469 [Cymbomonas tetramitiformis]KAK3282158.1 hypothetical protein CYMTET_10091 [Cymbomonas tetramitiformis]
MDEDMRVALVSLVGEGVFRARCLPLRADGTSKGRISPRDLARGFTALGELATRGRLNRVPQNVWRKLIRAKCFTEPAYELLDRHTQNVDIVALTNEFSRERVDVPCPLPVKLYNEFMISVDCWDREAHSKYSCPLKYKRMYKRIFHMLIDTWVYTFVCVYMTICCKEPGLGYTMPKRPFNRSLRSALADELAMPLRARRKKGGRPMKVSRFKLSHLSPEMVLGHTPIPMKDLPLKSRWASNRAECKECRRQKRYPRNAGNHVISKKHLAKPKATHVCAECRPHCPLHLGHCFISHHMHVWAVFEELDRRDAEVEEELEEELEEEEAALVVAPTAARVQTRADSAGELIAGTSSGAAGQLVEGGRVQDDVFGKGTLVSFCCTHGIEGGKCTKGCNATNAFTFATLKLDSGALLSGPAGRRGKEHLTPL